MRIRRVGDGPIISDDTDPSIGENIQGPSLVRAPDWLDEPFGRYLLYFADHKGSYIRLAFADRVEGPWGIHRSGSLHLVDSCFPTEPPPADDEQLEQLAELYTQFFGESAWSHDLLVDAVTPHIASPDVHERRRLEMYLDGRRCTSMVGDAPESILHSTVEIAGDWTGSSESPAAVVVRPEFDWEGADAPREPSKRSTAYGHVNQLRDPAVFVDDGPGGDGRTWLLYAVAGESGIALAEIDWAG
jgi:hypothetical protein